MPARRVWDADEAQARGEERRRDRERRRQQRPVRVPADNVYALLERVSRRESIAARSDPRRCALCGRPLTPDTMTVDHVVARALGGVDEPANLQAACLRCNNLKSRLEAAVQARRDRDVALPSVADAVLAEIADPSERARFAASPSVRLLLNALSAPEASP